MLTSWSSPYLLNCITTLNYQFLKAISHTSSFSVQNGYYSKAENNAVQKQARKLCKFLSVSDLETRNHKNAMRCPRRLSFSHLSRPCECLSQYKSREFFWHLSTSPSPTTERLSTIPLSLPQILQPKRHLNGQSAHTPFRELRQLRHGDRDETFSISLSSYKPSSVSVERSQNSAYNGCMLEISTDDTIPPRVS